MKMETVMRIMAAATSVLTIAISGCGKLESGSADKPHRSSQVSLPANFPQDIPVFKPSAVSMASKKAVWLNTTATAQDVHDFYERELKVNGWELTNNVVSNLQAKKDSRVIDINISPNSEAMRVSIRFQ